MKKVLFATTNPAKVVRFKEALLEHDIELISIKDLAPEDQFDVEETANDPLDNAYLKAKAYYDKLKMTTIAMDCTLYLEGVPDEAQPGTHVRRVNGKRLNDEEMIEHYVNLVHKYGKDYNGEKRVYAVWRYGLVILDDGERHDLRWERRRFYYVDKPSSYYEEGYPLDSISKYIATDEYFRYENKESDERREEVEYVISKLGKSV